MNHSPLRLRGVGDSRARCCCNCSVFFFRAPSDFQASCLLIVGCMLLRGSLFILHRLGSVSGIQRARGGGDGAVGAQVVIEQDLASGTLAEAGAELDIKRLASLGASVAGPLVLLGVSRLVEDGAATPDVNDNGNAAENHRASVSLSFTWWFWIRMCMRNEGRKEQEDCGCVCCQVWRLLSGVCRRVWRLLSRRWYWVCICVFRCLVPGPWTPEGQRYKITPRRRSLRKPDTGLLSSR